MRTDPRFDLPLPTPIFRKHLLNMKTVMLTFLLAKHKGLRVIPGQYFMLWLPGIDEIPISVCQFRDDLISFVICGVGSTSEKLIEEEENTLIGIRGPFGNGFSLIPNKNILILAGGMGIAPLRFFLHHIVNDSFRSNKIVLIQGAKSKDELLFREEFDRLPIMTNFCTDDGSYGFSGFPTEIMKEYLESISLKESDWEIFSCGPELMLKTVLTITQDHNLERNSQFCLADRFIRCGFGICGSCYMDDLGLNICQDGPVFRGDVLSRVKDFGKYGRKSDGSKYSLS